MSQIPSQAGQAVSAGASSATIDAMTRAGKEPPSGKTGAHHLLATNSHLVKDQGFQPEKLAPMKNGGQFCPTVLAAMSRFKLSMNLTSSSKPAKPMNLAPNFAGIGGGGPAV